MNQAYYLTGKTLDAAWLDHLEQQLLYVFHNEPRIIWERQETGIHLLCPQGDPALEQIMKELPSLLQIDGLEAEPLPGESAGSTAPPLSKELPLVAFQRITLFQTHALLLRIPFWDQNTTPWYYCNFINIRYRKYCYFDYTDYQSFYQPLFECTSLPYRDIARANRQEIFVDALAHDHYIYVWVDKFYISASPHFQNNHDIHPLLIYGYDLEKAVYHCALFEVSRGVYEAHVSMEETHLAFNSAKIYSIPPAYDGLPLRFLRCKKDFLGFNYFYQKRLLQELYQYWQGIGSVQGYHTMHFRQPEGSVDVYGLDVTKLLIDCIRQHPGPGSVFDYRVMHMVTENKQLIAERLLHLAETEELSPITIEQIQQYVSLAERCRTMQIYYMKASLTETQRRTFYPTPKEPQHVSHLCGKLTVLWKEEQALLSSLFPRLLKEILLDPIPTRNPSLTGSARQSTGTDEGGYYRLLEWEEPVYTGHLRLCNFYGCTNGRFQLSDHTEIVSREKENICYLSFHFAPQKIRWLKFYPDTYVLGKDAPPFLLNVFEANLLEQADIVPSSVYPNREDPSGFLPTADHILTSQEERFWSPETQDTQRMLQFTFSEPVRVGQAAIRQGFFTYRVAAFCLDSSQDGQHWQTVRECILPECVQREDRLKTVVFRFDQVEAAYFRVRFTQCNMDEWGFDIPNINYFALY